MVWPITGAKSYADESVQVNEAEQFNRPFRECEDGGSHTQRGLEMGVQLLPLCGKEGTL